MFLSSLCVTLRCRRRPPDAEMSVCVTSGARRPGPRNVAFRNALNHTAFCIIFGTTGAQTPLCVTFCARCFWRARGFCGLLGAPCWPACGLEAGPRRFLFILGRLGPLRGSLQHWHRAFFMSFNSVGLSQAHDYSRRCWVLRRARPRSADAMLRCCGGHRRGRRELRILTYEGAWAGGRCLRPVGASHAGGCHSPGWEIWSFFSSKLE